MNETFKHMVEIGIIPVVAIEDSENAVPLIKALLEGGLLCIEIALSSGCRSQEGTRVDSVRR